MFFKIDYKSHHSVLIFSDACKFLPSIICLSLCLSVFEIGSHTSAHTGLELTLFRLFRPHSVNLITNTNIVSIEVRILDKLGMVVQAHRTQHTGGTFSLCEETPKSKLNSKNSLQTPWIASQTFFV